MSVTIYRSTDASAPTLNGTAGSLIAVLDACLVNGYSGKAAAGWAKAFSGTNVAGYRAASGNRFYCGVDDTNAQNARVRGFEVMGTAGVSQSGSGNTGPFPADTQESGGLYVYKASAANSTARPWLLIASGTFFNMVFDNTTGSVTPNASGYQGNFYFGDFFSYVPADAYNTCIGAINAASTGYPGPLLVMSSITSDTYGPYAPRSFSGSGASVQLHKFTATQAINGTNSGAGSWGYPAPGTGGVVTSPILLGEGTVIASAGVRGMIPGAWFMAQNKSSFTQGDTFSGGAGGVLAGRTFEVVKENYNGGGWFVETSSWATVSL